MILICRHSTVHRHSVKAFQKVKQRRYQLLLSKKRMPWIPNSFRCLGRPSLGTQANLNADITVVYDNKIFERACLKTCLYSSALAFQSFTIISSTIIQQLASLIASQLLKKCSLHEVKFVSRQRFSPQNQSKFLNHSSDIDSRTREWERTAVPCWISAIPLNLPLASTTLPRTE